MQIRYERAFHPPAPVVEDAVRGPEFSTPADSVVTVLPARIRSSLHLYPREGRRVQGFGSAEFDCLSYLVNLSIAGVTADFELLILSAEREGDAIVGRDVLQHFQVIPEGPNGLLDMAVISSWSDQTE